MLLSMDKGVGAGRYILRTDLHIAEITGRFAEIKRLDGTGNVLIIELTDVGQLDGLVGAASRALYSLEQGDLAEDFQS